MTQFSKKLPIGIQTFSNLIREGYAYVDKTLFITQLEAAGKYYFLSRPRRFGKSLFLSTIKSAFLGERELFASLYIQDHWDWDQSYPVHISFGSGVMRQVQDLEIRFSSILKRHQEQAQLELQETDLRERFAELIRKLFESTGQGVVILVDEYDKPILDNIEKPETAVAIREELKNYYSVIKDCDPYIKFVFITGMSKFSKVSLFSGLNNLKDISLDKRYSALCGYSQDELECVFADRLQDVDLDAVKTWYNGYNWLGKEVYNPFDILLYLDSHEFANYWFETATPTFLVKLLQQKKYCIPELQSLTAGEEIVGSFDVEDFSVETLLFQTGYLTIQGFEQIGSFRRYQLTYPNLEVKAGLTNSILNHLVHVQVSRSAAFSEV